MRILLAIDRGDLDTTVADIPLRRELTQLLVGKIILEENHATTNEVALLILSHSIGRIVLGVSIVVLRLLALLARL